MIETDPEGSHSGTDPEAPRPAPEALPDPPAGPKISADEVKPLAAKWIANAVEMLGAAARSLEPGAAPDFRGGIGLDIVRRHFHTDKRARTESEIEAIRQIEANYRQMQTFLGLSDSIFQSADDDAAANNTRGYFGSGLTVAAYAYTRKSISFTSHYPSLGPKCRAAVILHQLAHFIDPQIRDQSSGGLMYDNADFDAAFHNVHCYPNFAVNAAPPYLDERYGMNRPND